MDLFKRKANCSRRGTETTFEIATGECFPLAALIGERATRTEHLAAEDTRDKMCQRAAKQLDLGCAQEQAIYDSAYKQVGYWRLA